MADVTMNKDWTAWWFLFESSLNILLFIFIFATTKSRVQWTIKKKEKRLVLFAIESTNNGFRTVFFRMVTNAIRWWIFFNRKKTCIPSKKIHTDHKQYWFFLFVVTVIPISLSSPKIMRGKLYFCWSLRKLKHSVTMAISD